MTEFANPFSGNVPGRKMSESELIRALRLDLSSEEEAINLYLAHADATENPLARAVLIDIANEERVHVGELLHLITLITGDEGEYIRDGREEVEEIAKRDEKTALGSMKGKEGKTVGSLRSL